ncbi:hypothetical protein [Bradyrhizobium icense]|uniref:hypothetical protein n=1 Tax=Bradyrhizobium icense TaxID=1274631 RepID=UPI0012EA563A|nr:hypothetical protein [Bradyrhizobium icense]
MSKTIAKQYFETRAAAQRCKPRSERKTKLEERLANLMLRQLRIECKKRRAA